MKNKEDGGILHNGLIIKTPKYTHVFVVMHKL